ncbi:MAG: HAD-IIA family hydrolase [Candidatus Hodarchaeota archaeon]
MEIIKKDFSQIKGLLVDIDGTLYFKGKAISGTAETVSKLRKAGLKLLFLTNTDSKSPKTVLKILRDFGFSINENEVFTPIIALKDFLSKYPHGKSYFVTTVEVENEFQDFHKVRDSEIPDFVIIGDFHDNWDVNRLNIAFKYVLKGARLLGTQGNKYYLDHNGEPVIDTGSFVQMIANAANTTPKVFGKPSPEYFLQALEKLKIKSDEALVIGDDIESDIQGAINASIKGILVKTGKGQYYESRESKINPFMVLDSFSSLTELLL